MLTGFRAVEGKDIPLSMPWRARASRCRMSAVREDSPRTFTIGYRLDETRKRAAGKPDREHIAATRQGRREATGKELPKSCERHLIYHFDEDPADIVRDVVANIGEDDLAGAFRTDCDRLKAVDAYVGRFHGGDVWCVMAAVEDGAAVLILNAIGCEDLEA